MNTERNLANAIDADAVIVGAGPVGLFQVFELGLLEVKAHVIDSLAYPGGQPVELYPDKPIYDIPAVPVCTGRELTDALLKQIEPFGPTFHFGQEASVVERQPDGRFYVETSKGTSFLTKTIFIAAGVGAFQPRTLKVEGIDKFDGSQLFYRVRNPADFAGKNLLIVGGGDSALDWTLNFVEGEHKAESVILLHRRDGVGDHRVRRGSPAAQNPGSTWVDSFRVCLVVSKIYRECSQRKSRWQGSADRVQRRGERGRCGGRRRVGAQTVGVHS